MQFLDTTPFQHDDSREPTQLVELERYRMIDPNRHLQELRSLQNRDTPVVIGLPQERRQFTASLWSVDDAADRLVFHAPFDPSIASIVQDPGRLWAAAYDGSRKIQFDVHGRTLQQQGQFWVMGSRLPSALYVLPRRTQLRARLAQGLEPVVRFPHPDDPQRLVRLLAHDISPGGLSLLAGKGELPLEVGSKILAAEIELDSGRVFFADLLVQNTVVSDEGGAELRIGCAWLRLGDDALALLEGWAGRVRQRRQVVSLSLDL